MIAGFLIVLGIAFAGGIVLVACAVFVKWLDDRQNRRARADFPGLHRTAAEDEAWMKYVARTHTHSEDR